MTQVLSTYLVNKATLPALFPVVPRTLMPPIPPVYLLLAGVRYDNTSAVPSQPSQSQLASKAVRAAGHFGNTTASSNTTVQYVINTATHNNASGFGTQYRAWHSSTSSSYGNIAYTNMPYITDAGTSCGANFENSGSAGLTVVLQKILSGENEAGNDGSRIIAAEKMCMFCILSLRYMFVCTSIC